MGTDASISKKESEDWPCAETVSISNDSSIFKKAKISI